MEIREAIVHRLNKDRHQLSVVKLRNQTLPLNDVLKSTVTKARDAYRNNPSRGYGIFHHDQDIYPFSRHLEQYLRGALDMLDFSAKAMIILEKAINNEAFATGGYVVFVNYFDAGRQYFMVILLKLKEAVGIDEINLTLNENFNLDIDHLHEAARVNINSWNEKADTYISFARKRTASSGFTTYFRDFIGCTEFIESKAQTTALVKAITDYCKNNKSPEDSRIIKAKAFDYFSEQTKEKKPISLAALSMRLDGENPEAFTNFLHDGNFEIPDEIEPDRGSYKQLKRIGGKDTELSISFDRSLIGKRIKYNKSDKSITITNLPPELISELDNEN